MQIWLDSPTNDYSGNNTVSRLWRGGSSDVSEVFIENSFDQEDAISLIGLVPWILVRFSDWTMVPLENLIASSRGSGTRIAVAIEDKIELNGAVYSLGGGVDAVLVSSDLVDEAAIMAGERLEFEEGEEEIELSILHAEVTSVESAGIGERVCIDLTRRIQIGEGIPVGSLSSSLCLVHGETISSNYVPTRPFRVNAGAIHSYILLSNGKTKYLSELISGDEVAVASESGLQGSATIGRLKIETRPLILIRFRINGKKGQIVVQQAETVRLVSPSKEPISVTALSEGDSISIISDSRMRHVGIAVDTPNGLMVPKIRNANQKNIDQISKDLKKVSDDCRNLKIDKKEFYGGSITITSLGGIGGTYFTPIINYPEVAILGISTLWMAILADTGASLLVVCNGLRLLKR